MENCKENREFPYTPMIHLLQLLAYYINIIPFLLLLNHIDTFLTKVHKLFKFP